MACVQRCAPCKVNPPSPSCECMQQCPEESKQVILTPNPCCEPFHCPEGTKKNIWQKIFRERKCNTCCGDPCVCKKKGKLRPIIRFYNTLCRDNSRKSCPDKMCGAKKCYCKPNTCPRKGCFPTDRSLCGCHFYFNVDKLPKKRVCLKSLNYRSDPVEKECAEGGVFSEEPVPDGEAPPPYRKPYSDGYNYTAESTHKSPHKVSVATSCSPSNSSKIYYLENTHTPVEEGKRSKKPEPDERSKSGKCSTVCESAESTKTCRRSTVCFNRASEASRRSSKCAIPDKVRCSEEPDTPSEPIQFGVTFTKSQTMYVRPADGDKCEMVSKEETNKICIEGKGVYISNVEETGSCDKIVTFNIGNKRDKDNEQPQKVSFDVNFPNYGNVHSESFSREAHLRKKRMMGQKESSLKSRSPRFSNAYAGDAQNRCQILDERVCQILNKLCAIEKKISRIEQKKSENVTIDLNQQTSTVSVCFRDKQKNPVTHCTTNSISERTKSGTAVIKISHAKSRTCQSVQGCPTKDSKKLHENENRKCDKIEKRGSCIVINLPNKSAETAYCPGPTLNDAIENCSRPVLWREVPEDLKICPSRRKCYCYDCMCKRERATIYT